MTIEHTTGSLAVDFDRAGRHLTVYLAGELDIETSSELTERIIQHIHPDDEVVWLDLAAVTFCGSVGLSVFVALHAYIEGLGGQLTLYQPSPQVLRTIQICKLDTHLSIRHSR